MSSWRSFSAACRTATFSCSSEDGLVAVGLGERAGGRGLRVGGVGLGLDLGVLEGEGALGDRDLLLGGDPGLLGRLAGVGLGDGGEPG